VISRAGKNGSEIEVNKPMMNAARRKNTEKARDMIEFGERLARLEPAKCVGRNGLRRE
jgi:hypothetical protein